MNNVRETVLGRVANNHLAIEEGPAEALSVFRQLEAMAAQNANVRLSEVDDDLVSLGCADDDLDLTVGEMVQAVFYEAEEVLNIVKLALESAHEGLIEAAIDGSLDSDANAWDLMSLADGRILGRAASLDQVYDDPAPGM